MVVIGVAGEGLEIAIKIATVLQSKVERFKCWLANSRSEKLLKWCHENELVIESWGLFWWAVVVLGLLIEVQGNHEARKISDRENSQLIAKAGEAYRDAARANERATILESTNLNLRIEIERLRSNNIVLQNLSNPREIELYAPISSLRNTPVNAHIVFSTACDDCLGITKNVGTILLSAKWTVDAIGTLKRILPGVSIGICSTNARWRESMNWSRQFEPTNDFPELLAAANLLANELDAQNIAVRRDKEINRLSTLRFNGVLVLIGPRPGFRDTRIMQLERERETLEQKMELSPFDPKIREQLGSIDDEWMGLISRGERTKPKPGLRQFDLGAEPVP